MTRIHSPRSVMSAWVDLISLEWLKGHDGHVSFSKLVLTASLLWMIYAVTPTLGVALVALVFLLQCAALGKSGLEIFRDAKMAQVSETVTTDTAATVKAASEAIEATWRRRHPEGVEPTP